MNNGNTLETRHSGYFEQMHIIVKTRSHFNLCIVDISHVLYQIVLIKTATAVLVIDCSTFEVP